MKTYTLIQKVKLTPEVLEGLDKDEAYILYLKNPKFGETKQQICSPYEIKLDFDDYSHILLERTITQEEIDLKHEKRNYNYANGFEDCANWLLSDKEGR